jgi:hypothetical protein
MAEERKKIPYEQAEKMLFKGSKNDVHTFLGGSGMLIGACWPRRKVLSAIKKYGVELSGPMATGMNHGLVLFDDTGALFLETSSTAMGGAKTWTAKNKYPSLMAQRCRQPRKG